MQRGQIIPRDRDIPHKKFLLRIYIGRDEQGKRKYHSETLAGTISQAKARLNEMLGSVSTGTFVSPSKRSLENYLNEWLTNKRDIEERTAADYRMWMEKCVFPTLGTVKLGKVTKLQIQRLYGSLSSDHNYSRRTITYVHQILSQALKAAVADRIVPYNPCDGARSAIQKEEKTEMVAFTFEETRDIIEKTKSERWGILWRLLLTTGLRPQEALALKWTDVSRAAVTVNRALVRQKNGTFLARDFHTKRPASRRQVSISAEMYAALEEHRKESLKVMMKTGKRSEWVFTTREATNLDPRTMRRHWQHMIAKHGIRMSRVYDCRHTHLTHLLSSGVNAKAVAARAGQANPTVLLTTYAHVLPEVAQDAANIVERRMRDVGTSAQVDRQEGMEVVG